MGQTTGIASDILTILRNSNGGYYDSSGTYQIAAPNIMRRMWDPVSLVPLGVAVAERRASLITNNTMQGASLGIIGAGGALPSGWTLTPILQREVVFLGQRQGIDTIGIRWSGVPTSTGIQILSPNNSGTAATAGETFVNAMTWKFTGSTTNLAGMTLRCAGEAGGTSLPLDGTTSRQSNVRTLTGTLANLTLRWNYLDTTTPVDFTIEIGLPDMNKATFALTPMRTTGSQASREADMITLPLANVPYNPANDIVVVEARAATGVSSDNQTLLQLDDGSENNRIRIVRDTARILRAIVTAGNVEQANMALGTLSDGSDFKLAVSLQANNFMASLNGGVEVTDTSGTVPSVATLRVGSSSTGEYWNSTIKRFKGLARVAASAAELRGLST